MSFELQQLFSLPDRVPGLDGLALELSKLVAKGVPPGDIMLTTSYNPPGRGPGHHKLLVGKEIVCGWEPIAGGGYRFWRPNELPK